MNYNVKIIGKERLNHDVIQFRLQRPAGYEFKPGQAIELFLEEPDKKGPAPFTFTGLTTDPYLELIIKIYEDRKALTAALAGKNAGDSVNITDPWDSFINKGPGIFFAGGAGVTPFIAILRHLKMDNNIGSSQLLFFNKSHEDIFLEKEFKSLLGNRYMNILTREHNGSPKPKIDEQFIRTRMAHFTGPFYVCGPPGFTQTIQNALIKLGAQNETVNVSF
jgi:ferredoxin-NADP reductase